MVAGATLTAEIHFGTDVMPAEDVYGLAYTLNLPASFIKPGSLKMEYDDSWLDKDTSELIHLTKAFDDDGEVETAVSRTSHTTMNGSGKIATLRFRLVNPLPQTNLKAFKAAWENVKIIDAEGNTIAYTVQGDSINLVTGIIPSSERYSLEIYPNPAKTTLHISTTGLKVQELQIVDMKGRILQTSKLFSKDNSHQTATFRTSDWHTGIYIVRIVAQEGVIQKQVTIVR